MRNVIIAFLSLLAGLLTLPAGAGAAASSGELELVRPNGIVQLSPIDVLPHPDTLDGKTIVLKWSAKPNGDIMMDRIAELLARDFPKTKVIKGWEDGETDKASLLGDVGKTKNLIVGWSTNRDRSVKMAKAMQALNPALVIGGQGD